MADVKISQLPAATTPVDGTEVLPIVQSATTKQVSIANLTAGRAMAASSLTLTTPLAATSGGTGIATAAQGSLLSATAADTFSATRTPTLGLAGTAAGTLGLSGLTSGVVTLQTAAAAGTWAMTLPTSGGTNGYILTTDGSGVTSWTNPTALGIDLDVGTTAITNGTAGNVLFQGSGNVLQESANFIFDGTNLGVGVTPSAWASDRKAVQINNGALVAGNSSSFINVSNNNYFDGTNVRYIATGFASSYVQGTDSSHTWYQAASGSAGATVTFTQAMTLDASGNLGIGTTSPSYKLDVNTGAAAFSSRILSTTTNAFLLFNDSGTTGLGPFIGSGGNTLQFGRAGVAEYMRIDSSGNVGIGCIPATSLDIGNGTTTQQIRLNGSASGTGGGCVFTIALGGTGRGSFGNVSGVFGGAFSNVMAVSGFNGLAFYTNNLEYMRIDTSGNVGIGTTSFGTSAAKVLAIATGTAPSTGPADTIQIFSTDLSAGNTIFSLRTEGTPVNANTTAAATHRIAIRVNGTVYYLLANTSA